MGEDKAASQAMHLALRRLGRREHSSEELAEYLEKKGIPPELTLTTVRQLIESKIVDDQRYMRILIRHLAAQGKGAYYIQNRLRRKGVQAGLENIRELIQETNGESELQIAKQLVLRRYPQANQNFQERVRAYNALIRRGFTHDIARAASTVTAETAEPGQ